MRQTGSMRVSAQADHPVRAAIELAATYEVDAPVKGDRIAAGRDRRRSAPR